MDFDAEIRRAQQERGGAGASRAGALPFGDPGAALDRELLGGSDKAEYAAEVVDVEEDEAEDTRGHTRAGSLPQRMLAEMARMGEQDEEAAGGRHLAGSSLADTRIAAREDAYHARRQGRTLSPERGPGRSYAQIMKENALAREAAELQRKLEKQKQDAQDLGVVLPGGSGAAAAAAGGATAGRKRRRWEDSDAPTPAGPHGAAFDATPDAAALRAMAAGAEGSIAAGAARSRQLVESGSDGSSSGFEGLDSSNGGGGGAVSEWEATPQILAATAAANGPARKRSRWDETPLSGAAAAADATPLLASGGGGVTPAYAAALGGATPTPAQLAAMLAGGANVLATPMVSSGAAAGSATPADLARSRLEAEIDERNRPLTDDELDALLPAKGYKVLEPPASYVPIHTPSRKAYATPGASATPGGFVMGETPSRDAYGVSAAAAGELRDSNGALLPAVRPEDAQFFAPLLSEGAAGRSEDEMDPEEARERRILVALLKIKNGTPPQRKAAMKALVDKAREYGAGPVFNQVLPLLMSPALEAQERHVLVKLVDKLLLRLDELVRPYVHKILFVVQPMLIDEDYYARIEGRELVSNLAKAAGLPTMIAVMRPDIDHLDEYVRNTTARAFAVVASALGIGTVLPFLKAVCGSKKAWQARHTGIKIIQQIGVLMGCAVLPHLKALVETVGPALTDEQLKVRSQAALAIAALAEGAYPYGIEAFDAVFRPLWKGIRQHRGKALAAFLKAAGALIPLMDPQYAGYYTKEVMGVVVREFASPDEEMKKIVLRVVAQCCATEGVEPAYIKSDILPDFFRNFWDRRMALDRRNYRAVVDTTVSISDKVGVSALIGPIVDDLKDESEPYRRMVMEAVQKILARHGATDVDTRLEELLLDGALFAFQEMAAVEGEGSGSATKIILKGFETVVNTLGRRTKPYLPQVAGTIKWRLNNKSAAARQQAAELVARIAPVMHVCGEDALLCHLSVVLYECLGEEYPEVLASILRGLRGVVSVVGMDTLQPPVHDLLPRLTPVLRNRNDVVQEAVVDLVGRIADRGAAHVGAKEWMRICSELLDMLKAPRKSIRRACVNTFGYIAKAIGPQDVMHALLNNLKVPDRTMRVCTTVAIAIVAETCLPFTVLPALLNEYRMPELSVQTGVLKALSFMFEYIGPAARDYAYAVAPLLQDALMERDLVHRQTACFAVKHLALGLAGLGCEDVLVHLLNYVWPNMFEVHPHMVQAMFEAVEAMRVALGPGRMLGYVLQGLWHPARKVRETYWRLYNNLYVYGGDGLTPAYPAVPDDLSTWNPVAKAEAEAAAAAAAGGSSSGGAATSGEAVGTTKLALKSRYRRHYLDLIV